MNVRKPLCEHCFETVSDQAQALAQAIAAQLCEALDQRPLASLAVSGGRSPVALFERLSTLDLPWSRVVVTLVDERCVPPNHPHRNSTLVAAHLLQGKAAMAHWLDWLEGWPDPQPVPDTVLVEHATRQSQKLPLPIDVVVLGMGDDGHTASWFAHSPGSTQACHGTDLLTVVWPATAPHRRLTLTRHAVASAHYRHLAWSGTRKASIYAQARQRCDEALPVSWLLHDVKAPIDVWYVAQT